MPRLSNEQHETFARLYVNGVAGQTKYHGGRAAFAAGYEPTHATKLLDRPEVLARIQELNDAMLTNADITAQRVMLELGRVAFGDVRKVYAPDGTLIPIHELDDDAAAVVAGFEHEEITKNVKGQKVLDLVTGEMVDAVIQVRTRTTKVKRYDKNPALTTLAKHFKLVGDEGDGVNALASALADRLNNAHKRAKQEKAE
jgi:phage terminase small subunit